MNVGVFLPNWVGDVVMATPTMMGIREKVGKDARVVAMIRPRVFEVLAGTPWVDDWVFFDHRSVDRNLHGRSVAAQLRNMRLDWAILLTNSWRPAAVAWLAGAKRRVGLARNGRGPLLTHRVAYPGGDRKKPVPAGEVYRQIAAPLIGEVENQGLPRLVVTARERAQADHVWKTFGWSASVPTVVINTGGAYGPAKDWPTPSFVEVARHIAEQWGAQVLILCGPAEREKAREVEQAVSDPRVRSLASFQTSIGLSKACVARARMMVSTDSGPRHFAAAFDVPVVSLFGPTDPRWSLNGHPQERILRTEGLDCQPCGQRSCPLTHHRCMTELSARRVLSVAESLWDSDRRDAA